MATYRTIIDTIKELASTKPNIGFVTSPDIYELNAQQNIHYPAFVLTPQTHSYSIDNEKMTWNFYLFLVDRLTEDKKNEEQVQSWAISELKAMVNELEEMGYLPSYSYEFTTFTEKFESLCAGAYVNLRMDYPLDECDYKSIFDILVELFQKKIDNKQDKLISGINIKTVNNETLLGSGNIDIQGGGYDDTEIRQEISLIKGSVSALNDEVGQLSSEVDKRALESDFEEFKEYVEETIGDIDEFLKSI